MINTNSQKSESDHIIFNNKIAMTTAIKVNLSLHVVGQRQDGYHLLDSLVVFCRAGDHITLEKANENKFFINGPYSNGLSPNNDNLILKAFHRFMQFCPQENISPVHICLEKNLPLASGVGGGSGDAAAVLHGLKHLWNISISDQDMMAMACEIGADVPICLAALTNPNARLMQGIGEKISSLNDFPVLYLVLINPKIEISTPAVFQALKQKSNQALNLKRENYKNSDDLLQFLKQSRNDLFKPALSIEPHLQDVLEVLNKNNALFSRMSGSGATCFGIFKDPITAMAAAHSIKYEFPHWYVCATKTEG